MKLRQGRIPPGGWHFEVAPGVELKASLETQLVTQIHEYRIRNNIPPGDIERDLDKFYCSNWPEFCDKEPHEYDKNLGRTLSAPREAMVHRVTRWITTLVSRMPRGGFPMVAASTAVDRAMICQGCVSNIPWRTGCPGCTSNVSALLVQSRQLRRTPHDQALQSCAVGGWANETAVHMNASELTVTDQQKADLPNRCWRKSL